MSEENEKPALEAPSQGPAGHQVFLDLLEDAGFFKQINDLEDSLKTIAGELQTFGESAAGRVNEVENLAAHVLAVEAVLATMLKAYPVKKDALLAEIKDRTAAMIGHEDGSPTVRALALDMLEKAGK